MFGLLNKSYDNYNPLQITIEYMDNGGDIKPVRIHTVVISTQHGPDIELKELQSEVLEKVVKVRANYS